MMIAFEFIATLVTTVLAIPVATLAIEFLAALLPKNRHRLPDGPEFDDRCAVLIPAHNEAKVIARTLESVLPQLRAQDRLVVVADNCSDTTADIVRETRSRYPAASIEVLERFDSERRGKGYALDHGVRHLAASPPGVVFVIDADCKLRDGSLDLVARTVATSGRAVQSCNLLMAKGKPTARQAVSTLALVFKNLVRLRGLDRLGFPAVLTGSGMAVPWQAIAEVPLASGNIVEDMQLGIDLAIRGVEPLFLQDARTTSPLPGRNKTALTQRKRWEHGHLSLIARQAPRLFLAGLKQRRLHLIVAAIDLAVPPLSLLAMLWLVSAVAIGTAAWLSGRAEVAYPIAMVGAVLALTIGGAWLIFARRVVPAKALLAAPFYMLWKLPLYFGFLFDRETQWIRTARGSEHDLEPSRNDGTENDRTSAGREETGDPVGVRHDD